MIIGKHFEWEASHKLPNEEVYGKCKNLHGHTYKLTVEVKGKLTDLGWVMNFSELKNIVNELVIDKYDHKHLNDFFDLPTAENILTIIVKDLQHALSTSTDIELYSITLYETSNSYVKWIA
jgi:6-pyruvoyltetrahydropterin/6-carboxytetrahydropterin synthase